jgi:N4-gp56 family major capsid protein
MATDASRNLTSTIGDGSNDLQTLALQRYFSKELLNTIEQTLVLDQFATKQPLPEKSGSKTMRFFRYQEGDAANVSQITNEGTNPAANALQIESVDVDLYQYGQVIAISDLASATELFNNLEQATLRVGRDAALKMDGIIRDELFSNDAGIPSGNNIYSGSTTTWGSSISAVDATDFLDAATSLKIQAATPINGFFVAVVGPQVARDLMNDGDWIAAHHYAAPDNIVRGEIGRLHGVRFVETTLPYRAVVGNQYTYASAGAYYGSVVVGAEAYACASLNSQSPFAPSIIITNGADKSDPLNLQTKVGMKFYTAAVNIQPKHIARVYSTTNYGQ